MQDLWSYDKDKHLDRKGRRWHFVSRYFFAEPGDEPPHEIYFRDDERTEFGVVRFERRKENPYRYLTLIKKIMNDKEFRAAHVDMETQVEWRASWK